MTALKPLPVEEMKVFKVIRVVGPEWNWFTGYLPYTRTLSKSYDYKNGDLLDENLIAAIKKTYPNSSLVESRLIFLEGELEDRLKAIRGGSQKKFTVNFFPYIDYPYERMFELMGKEFTSYLFDFILRLDISEKNEKFNYIYDSDLCYIDFKIIDELVKTIQPI